MKVNFDWYKKILYFQISLLSNIIYALDEFMGQVKQT